MHIIIGMPLHIIIMGAPMAIIDCMASQHCFMRAIIEASVGIIFIIMPSFVISQDILHAIGIIIMPFIIIGIIMPMPFMPFIIGIIGIEPMPFIGIIIGIMLFIPFMGMFIIEPFIIGMVAFMVVSSIWGSFLGRTVLPTRRALEAIEPCRWSFRLS